MASTAYLFNSARKALLDGTIDLDTDTIKAALLASTYTFSAAHSILADVVAHEVAAGNGYTTGGTALTTAAVTYAAAVAKFTADPAAWASLTKTFRFLLIYANKTANGLVNPLLGCILLDNTPADIVVTAADYSIQWNANGIFTLG